jgi:hypothetical protein
LIPDAADGDAEDTLIALFLIETTFVVKTIARINQIKNIRLNATALGNNSSLPSVITWIKNVCSMTPDIMGPIGPPIILRVLITAAEVAKTTFGINKIIIASRVSNSLEPTEKY